MTFSPAEWQQRFAWSARAAETFAKALAPLPEPEALADLAAGFLERAADLPGAPGYFDDPDAPLALARLCYAAPFLLRHLHQHPRALEAGALSDLQGSTALLPWPSEHRTDGLPLDGADQMRLMRRWKYDNYVRLTAMFLLGHADAAAVCGMISALADGLIQAGYTHAFRQLVEKLGLPLRVRNTGVRNAEASGFILAEGGVLGMGKLGGRELNYSSDVDLIFVQEGDHTPCRLLEHLPAAPTGPDAGEDWWAIWKDAASALGRGDRSGGEGASGAGSGGKEGPCGSSEFYNQLARLVSRLVSESTVEGFGFRVDLDLRPQGREGLLSPRIAAMENYYADQGREWERMAMIKARLVVGGEGIARQLQEIFRPFVFRRYLDFSALEGVAIVKHDIDRVHAHSLERNIKLGRGGIRENEFLVQALQLLHGGKRPELQVTSHQEALKRLEAAALLPPGEGTAISEDYWRLRALENRLQMVGEAQTHDLPDPGPALTRVLHDFRPDFAQREPALRQAVEAARNRNEERFRRFFAGMGDGEIPEPEAWRLAVRAKADPAHHEEALKRIDGVFGRLMKTRAGERCVFKLSRMLQEEELYTPGTEAALPRWLNFIEQIGNRNAIYTLIEAHPPILPWLAEIFREGGHHAALLIRHPEFLESFFALRENWGTLLGDLEEIANGPLDEEHFLLELQNTKARGLIRVLTAYLGAEGGAHRVMLSSLADATVRACTRFAWRLVCERMGPPAGAEQETVSGFTVLAMGKLGSNEMRFSSDLDLVFVHAGEGETAKGRAHSEFYTRLAQKIGNLLTVPTQFGQLYDLDHRLRPFGSKSLLAPSLASYRIYLTPGPGSGAEVWNFQAFTRIRTVAGDAALGATLIETIATAWRERAVSPREVARQVWEMLERLLAEANRGAPPEPGTLPLKYAVGGLLGYEFLSQAHFLRSHCPQEHSPEEDKPEATRPPPSQPPADSAANWTPPPPHETMLAMEESYRTIGALDERLSFYDPEGLHLSRPSHGKRLAAIGQRWNHEEIGRLCSRMEEEIAGVFRAWGA